MRRMWRWEISVIWSELRQGTPIKLALGYMFPIVKCFGKCGKRTYWDPIIGAWCNKCQDEILYANRKSRIDITCR